MEYQMADLQMGLQDPLVQVMLQVQGLHRTQETAFRMEADSMQMTGNKTSQFCGRGLSGLRLFLSLGADIANSTDNDCSGLCKIQALPKFHDNKSVIDCLRLQFKAITCKEVG